jgi:hypothetical protein
MIPKNQQNTSAIDDLLRDPTKRVMEATGVLSRIYRQLLLELDVQPEKFHRLLYDWLNDPKNGVATDLKRRSSARGNFIKELVRPSMSWKVFLKAVKMLKPSMVEFSFSFKFGHKTYNITQAYKVVDIHIPPEGTTDEDDNGDLIVPASKLRFHKEN